LAVRHLLSAVHCVSALLAAALTHPSQTCTHTAATALLAAELCPVLEKELDHNSFEVSWRKCIAVLRSLEDRYGYAKRRLATLEAFFDRIGSSSEECGSIPSAMRFPAPPRLLVLPSPGKQDTDEQANGEADIACEGVAVVVVTPNNPLLLSNNRRGAVWGADVNSDWFVEHPLWNTPGGIAYILLLVVPLCSSLFFGWWRRLQAQITDVYHLDLICRSLLECLPWISYEPASL